VNSRKTNALRGRQRVAFTASSREIPKGIRKAGIREEEEVRVLEKGEGRRVWKPLNVVEVEGGTHAHQ